MKRETDTILVDFHAVATAEKIALFYHMDGQVSAVIGTHFKTLTADARILPKGTAVITDAGRTGSLDSVGGLLPEIEIRKFLTQIPERSKIGWDNLELQGVLLYIDPEGKAQHIESIRLKCEDKPDDRSRDRERSERKQGNG
jgi:calcineurin-like phosphoesterase